MVDGAEEEVGETLREVLADSTRFGAVVEDGVRLIEGEVSRKRGLSGMALKTGFKTVKALRPGIIDSALGKLLPAFAPAVDPHYRNARAHGDVGAYFRAHAADIAEDLLSVTDRRAEQAKNAVMKRVYRSLRPAAKGHVIDAMPALAELVLRHVR